MKQALIIICAIFFLGIFTNAHAEEYVQLFNIDGWVLGNNSGQGSNSIQEFVQKGETVENWTQLITLNAAMGLQDKTTPEQFMEDIKKLVFSVCPGATWNVVNKGKKELMYEFIISSCPSQDPQHEIARVISGREGIYVVHYVTKKVPLSAKDRQKWIDKLNSVTISSGPPATKK